MLLKDVEYDENKIDVVRNSLSSIPLLEQELHINLCRVGWTIKSDEAAVYCTNQNYINKLINSDFFTLTEIIVSDHDRNKDFILGIKGYLKNNGLTIRSKKRHLTEQQKIDVAERLKKARLNK